MHATIDTNTGPENDRIASLLHQYHQPNGGIEKAMPKLIDYTKGRGNWDWVAVQHVAGAYNMMSRKMLTANLNTEKAMEGFALSAKLFSSASLAYDEWIGDLKDGKTEYYPQMGFATNPNLVYRTWGDILNRLKREGEAAELWEEAVKRGIWKNPMCRPEKEILGAEDDAEVYVHEENPFPEIEELVKSLLPAIASEFENDKNVRDGEGGWRIESGGLHEGRRWLQQTFYANGDANISPCDSYPTLCKLVREHDWFSSKGQVKLSVMEPGSVISPHAGPTMERLRMHCAVSIPPNSEESYMRVGDKRVTWEQGECFVFKEYCEHEVKISNEAAGQRSVLILDLPNPFLKSQPQSDSNKNDEL